jgi:hypothetical protein
LTIVRFICFQCQVRGMQTDEIGEISRKLDVGNERLKGIEANTGAMMETLKSTDSTMETLKRIDSKLDTLPEKIAKAIK